MITLDTNKLKATLSRLNDKSSIITPQIRIIIDVLHRGTIENTAQIDFESFSISDFDTYQDKNHVIRTEINNIEEIAKKLNQLSPKQNYSEDFI